jgi:hypothetical protein
MKVVIKFSVLFFLLFFGKPLPAQLLEVGIGLGKSVYWGDLNSPEFSTNISKNGGLAIQLSGRYNYRGIFGLKANAMLGNLSASDANSSLEWQKERNLSFKSKITEISFLGEYYFFGFNPTNEEMIFSPYATVGVAAFFFNPTTEYKGNVIELQPLGTEGQGIPGYSPKYKKNGPAVLFGAGGLVRFNSRFSVSFDIIGRRTFSDYIDDVGGNYVNYDDLLASNGELAAILSDRTPEYLGIPGPFNRNLGNNIRGGAIVDDYYFTAMVGFMFSLTDPDDLYVRKSKHKLSCPDF